MHNPAELFIFPAFEQSKDTSEYESLISDSYSEVSFDCSNAGKMNNSAGLCIIPQYDELRRLTGYVLDGSDTNTIIVSSTGAGKTRRVLSMYVLSCILAKQNIILHDPKNELYSFFASLLKEKGYGVRVLNLRDPMRGDRLNILEYSARLYKNGNQGRALEIVRGIAQTIFEPIEDKDDMFWSQASINLFLCYFIIAANLYEPEYVTLSAIYRVHVEGLEEAGSRTKMQYYLEEHKDELCYELGMPAIGAARETKLSIFACFTNGLSRIILNEEISDVLTKSTFDVLDFASENKPMALFIVTRDEAPQTYSTIVSAWIDMIYSILIDEAQKRKDSRLPNTVHFILEEFGNIAKLANVNDYLTASRSRGIRMVLVLQSLAQLSITYSNELATVLVGNSQNLVYMSSTDMTLVNLISERCGSLIDLYTKEKRPLLSPDRLTHLDKKTGETLMLLDRHYPFITYLPDISEYEMLKCSDISEIKKRKNLKPKHGLFSKCVDDLIDSKVKKSLNTMLKKEQERELSEFQERRRQLYESFNCRIGDDSSIDDEFDAFNAMLDDIIGED